ncbi:MAG: GatB/YqeY domain-containing protein [Proteobacteria bacterium]|nr:GatB/YqeY domain-containing protein [Pseudomonadota bacterium]
MGIKENIEQQMKDALRAKDSFKLNVLRYILSQIKNKEIDLRKPATDEDIIKIISTLVKQRKESLSFSEQANRPDLVEKEKEEIKILESFLPSQLSEEEVEKIIEEVIALVKPSGIKDMGKIMKELMPKIAGRFDGGKVNEMVRKRLS